jgi:hypothetical protein
MTGIENMTRIGMITGIEQREPTTWNEATTGVGPLNGKTAPTISGQESGLRCCNPAEGIQ